jgi:hypothetical protein
MQANYPNCQFRCRKRGIGRDFFSASAMLLGVLASAALADHPTNESSVMVAPNPAYIQLQPEDDQVPPLRYDDRGDTCCCPAESPGYGFWVRPEFLLWWVKDFATPALVTSSPVGTAREDAGVLGEPGTFILEGDGFGGGIAPSARIRFGCWFDPHALYGVEASYLGLRGGAGSSFAASNAERILARPFFNVEPGVEGQDAELVAFPGQLEGNISLQGETTLHGAELLFRHSIRRCWTSLDFGAGWRYQHLGEELLISDFKRVIDASSGLPIGTTLEKSDRFATRNQFNGGQVGVTAQLRRCQWSVTLLMKMAFGNTRSEAEINGNSTTTVPSPGADPAVSVTNAGLLAQETNIGAYTRDGFSVIPEFGISLGCDLTDNLRATAGYTFLYWSQVARPGDQIDTDLNLSQLLPDTLVGIPRPEFTWVGTDFWAQGLNFAIEYQF